MDVLANVFFFLLIGSGLALSIGLLTLAIGEKFKIHPQDTGDSITVKPKPQIPHHNHGNSIAVKQQFKPIAEVAATVHTSDSSNCGSRRFHSDHSITPFEFKKVPSTFKKSTEQLHHATSYIKDGYFTEAATLLEQTLPVFVKIAGSQHPITLFTNTILRGVRLTLSGKSQSASEAFKQADLIKLRQKALEKKQKLSEQKQKKSRSRYRNSSSSSTYDLPYAYASDSSYSGSSYSSSSSSCDSGGSSGGGCDAGF